MTSLCCDHEVRRDRLWAIAAMALVLAATLGLRWTTDIAAKPPTFDERWITRPIADLMRRGWTVETAIDFQEAKGPGMIWPYAAIGQLLVVDPNEVAPVDPADASAEVWTSPTPGGPHPAPPQMLSVLRVLSMVCFVISIIPLLMLAQAAGIRGPPMVLVAAGYLVLPYAAVLGQLAMGEASFVLLSLMLWAVVVLGCGEGNRTRHPVAGPILAGILMVVLLHSRPHAAAFAPAICIVTWQRESWRCWPWVLAMVMAVLLRIPLWVRWGGLVSSDFQNLHGLGFRLESLTYLAAALSPLLGAFLVAWLLDQGRRTLRWMPLTGVGLGCLLGVLASPDLTPMEGLDLDRQFNHYAGIASTATRQLSAGSGIPSAVILSAASAIGLGGLGAFAAMAYQHSVRGALGMLLRLQVLTLVWGLLLYTLTRGAVFDRYLLVWIGVLPVAWTGLLPRWLACIQIAGLAFVAAWSASTWLMA
ncbi:MAG: hypothetical protein QF561_04655 [Phycisphaerales bacterium]|jgi:hypothetical protein|nr:hypothetical protein [Phycisphaerales bacterium]